MTLAAGTKLGRYEIRSKIGAGGMGEVDRARDEKLNRHLAIKVLAAEFSQDENRRRRFEQEAQAAGGLNHRGRHVATLVERWSRIVLPNCTAQLERN